MEDKDKETETLTEGWHKLQIHHTMISPTGRLTLGFQDEEGNTFAVDVHINISQGYRQMLTSMGYNATWLGLLTDINNQKLAKAELLSQFVCAYLNPELPYKIESFKPCSVG
jgi:hypothetical protein